MDYSKRSASVHVVRHPPGASTSPVEANRSKSFSGAFPISHKEEFSQPVPPPQNLSAQSQSIFNETLVSTSPLLSRHPTTIIHKKLKVDLPSSPLINSGDLPSREYTLNEISPEIDSVSPVKSYPLNSSPLSTILNTFGQGSIKQKPVFQEHTAATQTESLAPNLSPELNPVSTSLEKVPSYSENAKELVVTKKSCFSVSCVIFSIVIFILVGGLVPSVLFAVIGSPLSTKNYINSMEPLRRNEYLKGFLVNNATNTTAALPTVSKALTFRTDIVEGARLNIASKFDYISEHYKRDQTVEQLMNVWTNGSVFYGLAYSPRNAMEPTCGLTRQDIVHDLALLSTVTTRIKTYGTQCNQAEFILDVINDMNLNMTLALGVWVGDNDTVNNQQLDTMKHLVQKYPASLFEAIHIGNEVLFRQDKSVKQLVKYIEQVKQHLSLLGIGIPVGTSEIGSLINEHLTHACDVIGANVHPFFGGGFAGAATNWTYDFVKQQLLSDGAQITISEVGWPSNGGSYMNAKADSESFSSFLLYYICRAREENYGWYYFEAFDEPWKSIFYEDGNEWETEWGVFTNDRKMKIDRFPDCSQIPL